MKTASGSEELYPDLRAMEINTKNVPPRDTSQMTKEEAEEYWRRRLEISNQISKDLLS
jgi:hypothetical protein